MGGPLVEGDELLIVACPAILFYACFPCLKYSMYIIRPRDTHYLYSQVCQDRL